MPLIGLADGRVRASGRMTTAQRLGSILAVTLSAALLVACDLNTPTLLPHRDAGADATTPGRGPAFGRVRVPYYSQRPPELALGLAIDVHRVHAGVHRLDVSRDYARGQGPSCEQDSAILNRLACELDRTGLFEQVITPDDDSDHRDHLHLAIAPL
jgi:hypothetical protein